MLRRLLLASTAVAVGLTGLPASHADVTTGPLSGGDDLTAALAFEQRMGDISLQQGKAVPVDLDASGHVVCWACDTSLL